MKNKNVFIACTALAIGVITTLYSCKSSTTIKDLTVVSPFDKEKYLGKWYEIARFDFRFERNLNNTTAEYSLNDDGTIKVVNKGYNYVKQKNTEATGKAKFVNSPNEARLKVSFFGPFYGGYNLIAIDDDYKYALVIGKNTDYLWLLSRETTMPEDIKLSYLEKAQSLGCDLSKLVWVEHN